MDTASDHWVMEVKHGHSISETIQPLKQATTSGLVEHRAFR